MNLMIHRAACLLSIFLLTAAAIKYEVNVRSSDIATRTDRVFVVLEKYGRTRERN